MPTVLNCSLIIKVILAFILPPLAVFLDYGCGSPFCIDVILTILGYIPGVIYALYVVCAMKSNVVVI